MKIKLKALARVYSCLQNGDLLLILSILSCRNGYDSNKIFLVNTQDKVSIFSAVNRSMALVMCQCVFKMSLSSWA